MVSDLLITIGPKDWTTFIHSTGAERLLAGTPIARLWGRYKEAESVALGTRTHSPLREIETFRSNVPAATLCYSTGGNTLEHREAKTESISALGFGQESRSDFRAGS